jgi:hypothetical protein
MTLQLSMFVNGDITAPMVPGSVGIVTITAYNPGAADVPLASVAPTINLTQWAGNISIMKQATVVPAGQTVVVMVFAFVSYVPLLGGAPYSLQIGAVVNDTSGNQATVAETVTFSPVGTAPESLPLSTAPFTPTTGPIVPAGTVENDLDFSQPLNSSYLPLFF